MAVRNLTNFVILDIFLIIVTCTLTSAAGVNNEFLPRHNYEVWATVPGARSAARSGAPSDDAMMRYFLYYMSQMSGNRPGNSRHAYYDRGVKRIGSEFLGKRSTGDGSAPSPDMDKRRGSEFVGKRMGSEFVGKRMGSEFVGKRMGSEFVGKRMGSEFVGKRMGSEFVGKRSEDPEDSLEDSPEIPASGFRWASFNTNHSDGSD